MGNTACRGNAARRGNAACEGNKGCRGNKGLPGNAVCRGNLEKPVRRAQEGEWDHVGRPDRQDQGCKELRCSR